MYMNLCIFSYYTEVFQKEFDHFKFFIVEFTKIDFKEMFFYLFRCNFINLLESVNRGNLILNSSHFLDLWMKYLCFLENIIANSRQRNEC